MSIENSNHTSPINLDDEPEVVIETPATTPEATAPTKLPENPATAPIQEFATRANLTGKEGIDKKKLVLLAGGTTGRAFEGTAPPAPKQQTQATADAKSAGATELAARALGKRLNMGDSAIRAALERGKTADFEGTQLYQRVFALADQAQGHPLPRALVPRIQLHGPKISRRLTTEWYARRVDQRFERCLER